MRITVHPAARLEGETVVPGDKSIAHRWLILSATARGRSSLRNLPTSLDVRSTASCLASVAPAARPSLEVWSRRAPATVEGGGSTWNGAAAEDPDRILDVEGDGRDGLRAASMELDCGNAGTTMRLLSGILAASPFRSVLTGDASLRARPMERVAGPLRSMGARVRTEDGHAPVIVDGGPLHGVRHVMRTPSAQVKSAVLLAGLAASGTTTVLEPAATRDHTERALEALGAPVRRDAEGISVESFQHDGFTATVPGDPSSAAFLVAAAALTGSSISVHRVGLNPTRIHYLDVMRRMGLAASTTVEGEELGEPVGSITVGAGTQLRPTRVEPDELALVIDEVPVLAVLAAFAPSATWFLGAGELRVKESDRLATLTRELASLGAVIAEEGDDLVVAGGGLRGGEVDAHADHRMAMAFAVAGLGAETPVTVLGAEAADVSFPGFVEVMRSLGCELEVSR